MMISLAMIALEAGLAAGLILLMRELAGQSCGRRPGRLGIGAILGCAAIAKAGLLKKSWAIRCPGWRWPLVLGGRRGGWLSASGDPASGMGRADLRHPSDFGGIRRVLWVKGFGPEDRELFRMKKADIEELSLPDPSTGGDAPR
jgi:hypothetical protein